MIGTFSDLAPSPEGTADSCLLTLPIGDGSRHRIAKSSEGHPILLIETSPSSEELPTAMTLELLSVQHGYQGKVHTESGIVEGGFSVIRCRNDSAVIIDTFLRLSEHLARSIPPFSTPKRVAGEIRKLVQIFQAFRRPKAKTIQGLWAELFVISQASDPGIWVEGWHGDPMERYDFGLPGFRVEVKSSASRTRRHYFSHEQLSPPSAATLFVASIFAEASSAGMNVFELMQGIQRRIPPSLSLRIEEIVAQSLGEDFLKAHTFRFDLDLATESLAFYDLPTIPKISGDIPEAITELRYCVDLQGISAVSPPNPHLT